METSEQTKVQFNGVDTVKWLGWLIATVAGLVWFVATTLDTKREKDKEQDIRLHNIETRFDKLETKVDAGFSMLNDKLDRSTDEIKKELEADKEIILKHEYINNNKPFNINR